MKDLKAIAFLLRRFGGRYWKTSIALVIVSVIAGFSVSVQPLVLAPALNILEQTDIEPVANVRALTLNNVGPSMMHFFHVDPNDRMALIVLVGLAYFVVASLSALINFLAYVMAIWLRGTIARDMAQALHEKLQSLPLSFFHANRVGDLISRYNNDVGYTAYFVDSVVRGIVQSAITALVCFLMLARTSSVLTFTVLGVGLIHLLMANLLRKPIRKNMHRENVARGGLAAVLQESLSNIRTIKSFAVEAFDLDRFRDTNESVRHNMLWNAFYKHLEEPLRLTLNAAALVVILVLSFRAYLDGTLSMSGFALFLLLAQKTMEPIAQLALHLLAVSRMLGCSTRVLEMFNTRNDMPDGTQDVPAFNREISLKNVSFTYASRTKPALDGVSLSVAKGEMVALVGPSGGGKSTLVDLVVRLHDPQSGVVEMDGQDVRSFRQAAFRRVFGIVPQECMLFNASVKENIVMGRLWDEAVFARCLQQAHCAGFIDDLPDGAQTLVGDRGVLLSGGQRQRIAIARAIYGQPDILVLDEATSALDSESERQVQQAIEEVTQGITAIVIAHRLSTVRQADRIVVVADGAIEAVGSHESLLAKCETYQRLCKLQFTENAVVES